MTKADERKMRRLELENQQLRAELEKHFVIYREQLYELAELRIKVEMVKEALD